MSNEAVSNKGEGRSRRLICRLAVLVSAPVILTGLAGGVAFADTTPAGAPGEYSGFGSKVGDGLTGVTSIVTSNAPLVFALVAALIAVSFAIRLIKKWVHA